MEKASLPKFLGNNLLFHAITHSNIKDLIALLEDNEADINARNINGSTPLHFSVTSQNPTVTEILLKFKANPNLKEYYEVGEGTALHRAVELNNFELCKILLDYGANPSLQCKKGFTALHYAARNGNVEIVQLLLNYGVDIHLRDKNGWNASYWAKLNKHLDVCKVLPPAATITPESLNEYKEQMRGFLDITLKLPKKKGRKKKKK